MKIFSFPRSCSGMSIVGTHKHPYPARPESTGRLDYPQTRPYSDPLRVPDEELRDTSGSGELEKSISGIVAIQNFHTGPGRLGHRQFLVE